jgi:hypothetical protein
VVLPVPVVPMTTWWERSRRYGIAASGGAGWPAARITAPATMAPPRDSSGTAPGAAIRARAVRTWCRHCRRSKAALAVGDSPPVPVRIA